MKFPIAISLVLYMAQNALAAPTQSSPQGLVLKSAPDVPAAWSKKGASDASAIISYDFHLGSPNDGGLDARIDAASKGQGEWLTTEELKGFVSQPEPIKQKIIQTITAKGIKPDDIAWNNIGNTITVKSTVAQAQDLLSASFSDYSYKGQHSLARTDQLVVPPVLADYVVSVAPLLDYPDKLTLLGSTKGKRSLPSSEFTKRASFVEGDVPASCNPDKVTPECRGDLYGTTGFKTKADDPTIGILAVGNSGYSQSDLDAYLKEYAPSALGAKLKHVTFNEGTYSDDSGDGEAALDIDAIISTVAPLQTSLYISGDETLDFFTSTFKYLLSDDNRPAVFSMSYGIEENTISPQSANTMCQYAKQLTSLGVTLVVASGDNGVNGGHPGQSDCPPFVPTYPSGCPYILSVGATSHFGPEVAVSNVTDHYFGGGGFSTLFPVPDYQKSATSAYLAQIGDQDKGEYNAKGRGFPDVAAQGALYAIRLLGVDDTESGTSASAPAFAAILALVNSARKAAGKGLLGWVNPTFYANPTAFTDVTKGGSYGCNNGDGFAALSGWDPSTGLGTPNFAKLRSMFGV